MPYKTKTYSSRYAGRNYHGGGRGSYSSRSSSSGRRGPKKDYIDPRRLVKAATGADSEAYTPRHSFVDFDVNVLIKTNLELKGFGIPTPIQDKTIPHALAGRDIIG